MVFTVLDEFDFSESLSSRRLAAVFAAFGIVVFLYTVFILFSPLFNRFNTLKLFFTIFSGLLVFYGVLLYAGFFGWRKLVVLVFSVVFAFPLFILVVPADILGLNIWLAFIVFFVFVGFLTSFCFYLDSLLMDYLNNVEWFVVGAGLLFSVSLVLFLYSGFGSIGAEVDAVGSVDVVENDSAVNFVNISYTNRNFVRERVGYSTHGFCVFNESSMIERGSLGPGHYTSIFLDPGDSDYVSEHISWDDHAFRGGDIQLESEDFEANSLEVHVLDSMCNDEEEYSRGLYIYAFPWT